jgi:glutamate synthase (NADPH/NADH) large chain
MTRNLRFKVPLDRPLLAVAAVDNALREQNTPENLRRKCGIVIRSAGIRNLHDIILLCSFGADAINPYAMLSIAKAYQNTKENRNGKPNFQLNLLSTLRIGLEKVISTVGCHELRGYGRICGSIGLSPEIANIFHAPNFLGSAQCGLNWSGLESEAEERVKILKNAAPSEVPAIDRIYPKFAKQVGIFIQGNCDFQHVIDSYREITSETPIAIRHLMQFKTSKSRYLPIR